MHFDSLRIGRLQWSVLNLSGIVYLLVDSSRIGWIPWGALYRTRTYSYLQCIVSTVCTTFSG